jgi:UDP-2,3-diacylglucosamine hydrolase
MRKLALIAGGGQMPLEVAAYLKRTQRPYVVIRIKDVTDPAMASHPSYEVELGHFAQMFALLQQEACSSICMVGYVKRPDFTTMGRDAGGKVLLPTIEKAGRGGDDSLLRQVAKVFEAQGFAIEGAHEACPELLLGSGLQAGPLPDAAMFADINEALRIAKGIGRLDIGQAVVVAGGVTLAVEAQEGTQNLLERLADLPPNLLGKAGAPKGVLAKLPKPIQDLRLDMPSLGVNTIEAAAAAHLCGIVARSGGLLIADKAAAFARAEALGLFIYGISDTDENAAVST